MSYKCTFFGRVSFVFWFIWISYGLGTRILKLDYVKSQTRKLVLLPIHPKLKPGSEDAPHAHIHAHAYNRELGTKLVLSEYLATISHVSLAHLPFHYPNPPTPNPPSASHFLPLNSSFACLLPSVIVFCGSGHVRKGIEESREEENKTHPRRCGYWGWMFICQIGCFARS
jgi:hypothetical protein